MSPRPTFAHRHNAAEAVAPLHDALDELAGAFPTPIIRAALICLAGLRIVSIAVLAIVVFVGLFVIVGNVPSEAVVALFVWTAVSLSVAGFIVVFVSKYKALLGSSDKPLLRLAYAQGILTALVMQVAYGYSWVPQRFLFDIGAVIAFQAILLFGGLVIHIRNNRSRYSLTNIFLGVLAALAFLLLSWGILNASRSVDILDPGIVSLFIMTAQTVAVTVQFSIQSTFRYCFVFSFLALAATAYAIGGAYLFYAGGGF